MLVEPTADCQVWLGLLLRPAGQAGRQGAAALRVYIKDHGLMTVKWLA